MEEDINIEEKKEKEEINEKVLASFENENLDKEYKDYTRKALVKSLFIFIAIGVLLIICGILELTVLVEENGIVTFGIIAISFGVILPLSMIIVYFYLFKKQMKTNYYMKSKMKAVFYNFFADIETESDSNISKVKCKYESLYKVLDYENMYIFYTSNVTAFTVGKGGLKEGNTFDLSNRLQQILGKKYKLKFKR